ncbi:MAG: 6-phosphogluconolactonase [Gammaproteobacteria bacterium]|jgi:6-phosphogluconolactonase
MSKLTVAESPKSLCQQIADWWQRLAKDAIADHGKFHVALAGGNTPRILYQMLASDAYAGAIDWQHIKFYFGDERAVPLNHSQSNFSMAHDAMLDTLSIPSTNIYPMITDLDDLENSARHYEKILRRELPAGDDGIPQFDLILLGMGDDGHTASLFPDTPILSETQKLVAMVYVEKVQASRLSFTLPLINHARHVGIMVTGDNKAGKLKQVLIDQPGTHPVEKVHPDGELRWFADEAAAKYLPDRP